MVHPTPFWVLKKYLQEQFALGPGDMQIWFTHAVKKTVVLIDELLNTDTYIFEKLKGHIRFEYSNQAIAGDTAIGVNKIIETGKAHWSPFIKV